MKKCISLLLLAMAMQVTAVEYCATSSWGFAGNSVTGGGNASPTYVTNETELRNALVDNSVVIVTEDITVTYRISVHVNNLTLMALPGVEIINQHRDSANSGILIFKSTKVINGTDTTTVSSNNIILRNLTLKGAGAFDCDGFDLLSLEGATNVWVDHCDFQDGVDDNFDIKNNTDNITVSWCRFRYLIAPQSGGLETDDHRFSNLIGSSKSNKPADGLFSVTYAYCWWDEGCVGRMVRCRNAELHFLNCYWNSSVSSTLIGPERASCYCEGCTFSGRANERGSDHVFQSYSGTESENYATFVHCEGNYPTWYAAASVPSYTYDHLKAEKAVSYVTNSSCGAGATLNVTAEGVVSASCEDEEEPESQETECCVNLGLGAAPTVGNGGIPAEFAQMIFNYNLTHTSSLWNSGYLNLGSNKDTITFDFSAYKVVIESVSFDVTIPNWASASSQTIMYHWNSDENESYPISSANKETVTLTAPANAKSFTIRRSAGKGTQISEVCFTLKAATPDTPTALDSKPEKSAARKVLRSGQVLILREGKTYNLFGTRVD